VKRLQQGRFVLQPQFSLHMNTRISRKSSAATVCALLVVSLFSSSHAAVITAVSNIGQADGGGPVVGKLGPGIDGLGAVGFSTGATTTALVDVRIPVIQRGGNSASGFTVALFSGIGAGGPTGLVGNLVGDSSPVDGFTYSYSPVNSVSLLPNTQYWVVVSAPTTPALTFFTLGGTHSTGEDSGGLPGWSISDVRWGSGNGGVTWGSSPNSLIKVAITVDSVGVPESTGFEVLFLAIAALGLFARSRN
jgi:hypothetical protein